jgi:hypothetical protein
MKRARGRPPAGKGVLIGVRLHAHALKRLDDWIGRLTEPTTRPEAIRILMEHGLQSFDQADRSTRK